MQDRIYIFSGHFGSGKTEVALNFALAKAAAKQQVSVVDMDTVNPYFRTYDAKAALEKQNIRVIASPFAGSNVDMPIVPAQVQSVFQNPGLTAVFDVGGDDDGARALGVYADQIRQEKYQMYFVVNTSRPLTRTWEELLELSGQIEKASKLRFTGIVNNTNLGRLTDPQTLLSGYGQILKLSEKMGIPLVMHTGTAQNVSHLAGAVEEPVFPIEIQVKLPFE